MSHSFYKAWLHIVFATKNREPLILPSIEFNLFEYIKQELEEMNCPVSIINGMPDHVHLLIQQNPQKSISETIKQIKGSSSHWINQQDLINRKFAWQTGYGVFSVSESQIKKVYNYIRSQKTHHQKQNFPDELYSFLKLHNITQSP